jgi:tRNA G18 (ribose-2'-O)-methylase SpoU
MAELEPHYAQITPGALPPIVRQPVHVVVDNVRSAFNVGSFFRTADAAAAEHMHLCGMTAHPPHKKLEKTALGAFEYVPWTYYERTTRAIDALKDKGIPVVAVEAAEGSVSYTAYEWPQPVAIVFGNEVTGISEKILNRCDATVSIPMLGYKNTVNVATAFGVILFEVLRSWDAL